MKAWVLHSINDIQLEEVNRPELAEDEVLIQVKATGICGSDIPRIYETGAHRHPLIPGHEFSGQVIALGKNVDEKWNAKRVGIFPLIPCKECVACKKKRYEMCRNYSYLGSRRDGGFAEYVAVPKWNLIELPDKVSYEAAAMLEPMAVATHSMRRVNPTTDDVIAICGLGTIGLLLLMIMKNELGKSGKETQILVIGNKEFQKKQALLLGIPENCYCDSKSQNVNSWIMEKTDGIGVDVFFECVGKNETVTQAIDLTAPAGRVCLVGNPYSDMLLDKNVYWKILRNQLMVTGTWNSSFDHDLEDDWSYVVRALQNEEIKPEAFISHRYVIEELEKGFQVMRDKQEDYIKIMMVQDM